MPRTKLVLKKESLTALTTDELSQVAGGVQWTPGCPLIQKVHDLLSQATTC